MRVTIGTGECNAFFERCLLQAAWGESCQFRLLGTDPQFRENLIWNGFEGSLEAKRSEFEAAPAGFCLRLEIEVASIRPKKAQSLQNVFEMSTEEKRERVEALKKEADEKFKSQVFSEAIELYTRAYKVAFFEDGPVFSDLKLKIGSNLAFAYLKAKKYEECINMNDQFIRFGYDVTEKNYFRNGQASELYGRLEEAIKFYQQAIEASSEEEYKNQVEGNIAAVKKKIADKSSQMRKNMQKIWS